MNKMFSVRKSKAFTLIEVLVVIAILAGLVAILFPNFMDARARARDTARKSDLISIQKALEFYKDNQNPPQYPADASFPAPCSSWTVSSQLFMAKIPGDPLGNCSSNLKKYYYHSYAPADSLKYDLYACLENKSDVDGNSGPQASPYFDTQTGYLCTSGVYYRVTEP